MCLFPFRDLRVRKYLGVRYDARLNLFDWDYQMRLAQRDVSTELSFKIWDLDHAISLSCLQGTVW